MASLRARASSSRPVDNQNVSPSQSPGQPDADVAATPIDGIVHQSDMQNGDSAEEDEPNQNNPDHYAPWFPAKDDGGVLSALHGSSVFVLLMSGGGASFLAALFLMCVPAFSSEGIAWDLPLPLLQIEKLFRQVFNLGRGTMTWIPVLLARRDRFYLDHLP
jgi:hypothetical protein